MTSLREDLDALGATVDELDAALTKAEAASTLDPDVEAQAKRIAAQKPAA